MKALIKEDIPFKDKIFNAKKGDIVKVTPYNVANDGQKIYICENNEKKFYIKEDKIKLL